MTVSYQNEVASSTSGGFTRLLFLWRGSLYKLIYRELLLFLVAFALLSALYRNVFTVEQRKFFERAVVYCDSITQLIPLSFVLGFYVTYVADRWWKQYMAIPSPDRLMHSVALYVGSEDEKSRILRRTLMRYINLSLVLVLRSISSSVKRRFPTMAHIVEAGFITKTELEMLSAISRTNLNIYWIPCTWFISLLKDAKNENKIIDKSGLKLIVQEFNEFRSKCGLLWSYDWISIPLVYTQVVTVATYSFFIATLIGRQYINHPQKQLQTEIDIYLPVFTILQFLFYMGLLKVAEQLINPFGEDDEDFELNWLIDRHTKVSYLGVDTLMGKAPPLVKDKYFNDVDITLPYTNAAAPLKRETHRGSTYRMKIPKNQQPMYLPDDKDREKKLQDEKNARNSFPSISSKSNSAYVLQDNISNVDIEQAGEFNKGLAPIQEHQGSNMKSFFRTASIRIANNQYKTFKQRWQRRSFNSAINSYCSMKSMSNSSFETSPENEKNIEDNKESESTKTQRKRSSSGTFVNLTTGNPLSNMDMLSK